ncbi:transcription initiation factor TFIID subunit 12 isoform X2 [Phalaenopsis equestris]|uniref:transcription initiation factor TFIID subunit 12 isoform X2 n=1 Tax=Phalaenopsis equestris TaxID=78828 RepID=UPI0009E521A4|nr:transcription initiation factor TFIID subunit 12 isoform X2 [Phalaenopsis equestris]
MEPPEAPSSADPLQHTAAEPPPEEPILQLPSEAQPTITPTPSSSAVSVSLSSSSLSSAVSPSQPQSQSSLHQRQPVAARTRSHTQLGQSQSTPSTSSSSSSASSIQKNGPSIGLPAALPHHARPPSSAGYSYGYPSHFSQPFASSSSPSQSLSQPFGGFPRSSLPTAEQSSGSNAPSASFSQPFSAMPRSSAGAPDQQPNSNPQFKPPVPGVQTIGMIGSLSGAPRMKASGIQHQQRLGQPIDKSLPQSATNQTSNAQNFPNPGLSRPSMPSLNAPISAPQSAQSLQQQWMANQGKQTYGTSFPSSSHRPHTKQQYSPPVTPSQLQVSSSQQQQQQQKQVQLQLQQHNLQQQQNFSMPHHLQDLHSNRNQQSLQQQHQQGPKGHASINQRLNKQLGQPVSGNSGSAIPITEDPPETGNQILSKRGIQELLAQIDPCEKLEPEVEDVLMEIADEFVDSITTAACSLAKHRRSTALEAKDIVLYVERNWNMTLPGFGGDDIKLYKKPHTTDIHKERLAMIKKSMGMANDMVSAKNVAAGQVAANSKSQAGKSSVPTFTSPKVT